MWGDQERAKRTRPRTWTLAVLLMGAVVLSTACGGKDTPSQPAAQTGAGRPLGSAEGDVTGMPPAAEGTARPVGGSAAVATARGTNTSPAGAAPTPGRGAAAAVATPHPETPDPCGLVTLAEAEAAIGGRPFPGQVRRSRDSAEVRCTYDYLAGSVVRSVVVSVWKGSEARPVYELRRSAYSDAVEEVRGLGDRAFVVRGDDGWINVLKGDVYLSIQLINQTPGAEQSLSGQELRSRAMALARTAAGRL